jgi:hypothetical protein
MKWKKDKNLEIKTKYRKQRKLLTGGAEKPKENTLTNEIIEFQRT